VYTPIEVVDFIIHSVEDVMQVEFGKSLSDEGVSVLDPFTGTGTFIVRLLQSGIIKSKDLKRKFESEIHANEIVLLAYYIASVNIEETYHGITGGEYASFDGAVLTDTFQLGEEDSQVTFDSVLAQNMERVAQQKKIPMNVIISNPPYSSGQREGNDNNKNLKYKFLDTKITNTFAKESSATLKTNIYNSYMRAFRFASDRIGKSGVIGFVTPGTIIEANSADGFRKSLANEFSKIYCFNLRGNGRTSGEECRREGEPLFAAHGGKGGSLNPIAITILVKTPDHKGDCEIYYYDIGDYLKRNEKLGIIKEFGSIKNINWQKVVPNNEGDWINHRNDDFAQFLELGKKESASKSIFQIYSSGVKSNRDPWVYNFSKDILSSSMSAMIKTFNSEIQRFHNDWGNKSRKLWPEASGYVESDSRKIKWTRELLADVLKNKTGKFKTSSIIVSLYRPFCKQWLYFSRRFNNTVYQIPSLFPTPDHKNVLICVNGAGAQKDFSVFITDLVPDFHAMQTGQCFPLYFYKSYDSGETLDLLMQGSNQDSHGFVKNDAITDFALDEFRRAYSDLKIGKEDIFYYIYGLLHSKAYRSLYQNDLKKMLPRIPFIKNFRGFSKIGKSLAALHLNYENVEPYDLVEEVKKDAPNAKSKMFKIHKMKFGKNSDGIDRSKILINEYMTLSGIPNAAYDYVVNGKSAIEWAMDRYEVTVDLNSKGEGSGIKNDPNEWSNDPRYIIDLIKRIVRVSMETNRLLSELPKFELVEDKKP
jgi:predicted helicase